MHRLEQNKDLVELMQAFNRLGADKKHRIEDVHEATTLGAVDTLEYVRDLCLILEEEDLVEHELAGNGDSWQLTKGGRRAAELLALQAGELAGPVAV